MKPYRIIWITFFIFTIASEMATASVTFSGNATLTSSYIFRGIRQFDGVAFQGTGEIQWKNLTGGFWASNIESASSWVNETDLYVKIGLPIENFPIALGATVYSYDFNKFNEVSDREIEVYVTASWREVSIGIYMVPLQESTKNDLARTYYWIDSSWNFAICLVNGSIGYAFGTYSSRFFAEPRKDAVNIFSVSASKKIIDPIVLSWNATLPTTRALDNQFWMSLVFSF